MKIDDRLKKIIFKKLAKDLSHVEVIPYEGDIWFIDRNDKYWYLILKNNKHLWWRHDFFDRFFQAFSLQESEYRSLIAEWVEQSLNQKVKTFLFLDEDLIDTVEQVLNSK